MEKSQKNLDVVYLLKPCSEDKELRYSLRSLVNLKHRNVYIYGGNLPWLDNIKWIAHTQTGVDKWHKSNSSFLEACRNPEISEDFILMNDDFFVMEPTELNYFYYGTLKERGQRVDSLSKILLKQDSLLRELNKPTKNYALHMPMIFNKKKALELSEKFPDELIGRSLYANYYELGGESRPDCKIYSFTKPAYNTFLSTTDTSFTYGEAGKLIRQKFDKPCKYERI